MLWWVHAIIKDQFTVVACGIVEEEFFIADGASVTHLDDEIVALTLVLYDSLTRTINAYYARFIKSDRLR